MKMIHKTTHQTLGLVAKRYVVILLSSSTRSTSNCLLPKPAGYYGRPNFIPVSVEPSRASCDAMTFLYYPVTDRLW